MVSLELDSTKSTTTRYRFRDESVRKKLERNARELRRTREYLHEAILLATIILASRILNPHDSYDPYSNQKNIIFGAMVLWVVQFSQGVQKRDDLCG